MLSYQKTTIQKVLPDYLEYAKELRLVDTYWEDLILESQVYRIYQEKEWVGCFSFHEKEQAITSFFLFPLKILYAQTVFQNILTEFNIKTAYVVSNDELLLSLCLDFHREIRIQAYFFDDAQEAAEPPVFAKERLSLAKESDLADLEAFHFFDNLDLSDDSDIKYVLRREDGTLLGAGHIQTMLFAPQWGACGMVTAEKYRKRGVGRSIICHLKQIVKEKGLIPIAGCYYLNYGSRATLESCGFSTKTRFLKVFF